MQGLLRRLRTLVGFLPSREPALRFGGNASADWLPPVLGPSDWSDGLLATMADRSSAWYFERY